ncbi:hypothetical protein L202_01652 [Cryptococcus amylolentus CBS 6039]|uniref:Scamp-domain-containing protein n=1 Tax=Cryptococcus amylolentus CBS 6039 TaxID=1295533 RepID=A0A1E3I4K8_9TREE|nr:hypothetical protein L202_01652 [Cryptococcus amylolentus CBS 6039]ODN83519.1 hypothetical protein L202_01652 [Cryptococcus amylolentus CBS 6039]
MSYNQADPFADSTAHATLDTDPFADSTKDPFTAQPNESLASFGGASGSTSNAYGDYGYGGGYAAGAGANQKADELRKREEELARREQEFERRQQETGTYANNWPPLYPFVHYDPSIIPDAGKKQSITLIGYQWYALVATLILNLLGCIFLLISGSSEGGADMASSASYLVFITLTSFILWFRPIYLGYCRNEGKAMAVFFYIYFLFAGFHLAYSMYMFIGIPSTGSAGLINTISMFSQGHILAAVFGTITSVGWAFQVAAGGFLYKRVWDFKNGNSEISMQNATDQLKSNSIKTIVMHQSRL